MSDRDFGNGANADMPHYGNNFSIEASQVIYAGGAVASGVKLAELARQSAEVQVEAKRGDERFLLVGDYMDLFKQRNLLEVYDSNIVQTRRVLRDMRAKESRRGDAAGRRFRLCPQGSASSQAQNLRRRR